MNYFEIIVQCGIDIINFGRDTASAIIETFLTELRLLAPILEGTEIGNYSLLATMVGLGLPAFIVFTIIRYVTGFIT